MISERLAVVALMSVLSLVIIFHLLVLTGVIPFDMVWGGRLEDGEQMVLFELFSIGMNVLMLLVVALRGGVLVWKVPPAIIRIALWLMFALFFLNTVGNLLSNNPLERLVFTPLTFLLGIFSMRLALNYSGE